MSMTKTLSLPLFALAAVLSLPGQIALAEPAQAASKPAVEAKGLSPDQLIRTVAETLLGRIKADREALSDDPKRLYGMVDEVVLPHFDFPLMGRLVLGSQWEKASAEQQKKFLDSFKTLLVKTYGNALLQYSNEQVQFSPAELGPKPGRAQVSSTIKSPGSEPVKMEYRMRKLEDRWLVYDVAVDNISLVTNYRGTYAAEIQRGGLDSLIAKLQEQAS